jgi:adenylate cyclase class IV
VDGLGSFLELEAVLTPDAPEAISRERLDRLRQALGMSPEEIAGSYADLLGLDGSSP